NGDQSSNTARSSGAVYVFVRTSTTWQQQAYIKASNTEGGDQFGGTVALNGDTLAAGAFGEDSDANGVDGNQDSNGAPSSGAVYVLTRSGATWQQQAYIKAANTDLGDRFGVSLALDDGTLAVGASNEDSSASGVNGNQSSNAAMESGAVYVFAWSGTTWRQQAYVKSSNPDAGDFFGASVAVDAGTMAVGALFESGNNVVASGAVFIRRIAD
ncbi:MAG: integrin, partial [Myxococcota bacterium]